MTVWKVTLAQQFSNFLPITLNTKLTIMFCVHSMKLAACTIEIYVTPTELSTAITNHHIA